METAAGECEMWYSKLNNERSERLEALEEPHLGVQLSAQAQSIRLALMIWRDKWALSSRHSSRSQIVRDGAIFILFLFVANKINYDGLDLRCASAHSICFLLLIFASLSLLQPLSPASFHVWYYNFPFDFCQHFYRVGARSRNNEQSRKKWVISACMLCSKRWILNRSMGERVRICVAVQTCCSLLFDYSHNEDWFVPGLVLFVFLSYLCHALFSLPFFRSSSSSSSDSVSSNILFDRNYLFILCVDGIFCIGICRVHVITKRTTPTTPATMIYIS